MEIKKGRIILKTLSHQQLKLRMERERDPELKEILVEMLMNLECNGKQRIWYSLWNIFSKEEGQKIGEIGFHGKPSEKGEVEISIFIQEKYRRQGYGLEAMNLLSSWALSQDKINYIQAKLKKDNTDYQKLLAKAGFFLVSELDEQQLWEKEKQQNYKRTLFVCTGIAIGFILGEVLLPNCVLGIGIGAFLGYLFGK